VYVGEDFEPEFEEEAEEANDELLDLFDLFDDVEPADKVISGFSLSPD